MVTRLRPPAPDPGRALAAVSGPSSLAAEAARAARITLVGFLRSATMNRCSPAA